MSTENILAHTKWECKFHIVFASKLSETGDPQTTPCGCESSVCWANHTSMPSSALFVANFIFMERRSATTALIFLQVVFLFSWV